MPFFDLASLAKPLVTAPLALRQLDLDQDRRSQLGFGDRPQALTVRQLLSHSAGLPPWLPFTGEPLAVQLRRGGPAPAPGVSVYSDLGYRLLADLLELETGRPFRELGAEASGLSPAPWADPPRFAPQGADAEMWRLAEPALAMPGPDPNRPNDLNARAGMQGHAGFGATPAQLETCLEAWVGSGAPLAMAVDTAQSSGGACWGLGLQRALTGPGRFGSLLAAVPPGLGGLRLRVLNSCALRAGAPALAELPGAPSAFWFHLGYTGPALFFRPEDGLCIALLAHRLGPEGELLDGESLRARRWQALKAVVAELIG